MKKILFLIIAHLWIFTVKSQNLKGSSFESSWYFGKIVKHTPKLLLTPPPQSIGTEIHFNKQLYGKKVWHEWQRYPSVGASFLYYNLGDKSVLGNAFGIFPTLDICFLNKNSFKIYSQIGAGIAYVSKYYDINTNPLNNAVGSHINEVTHVKINMSNKITPQWSMNVGVSFTHFSNGSSQHPNYGVNIASFNVGAKYQAQPIEKENFIHHYLPNVSQKKWGFTARTEIAWAETSIPRGPKYPDYIASIACLYKLKRTNILHLGINYEQDRTAFNWALHSVSATTRAEAFKGASRWTIYAADEIFLGNVSILLEMGVYLNRKSTFLSAGNVYNKLGLRYYFKSVDDTVQGTPHGEGLRFFIGSYLKAHRISAEYFSWGGGVSF